MGVAADDGSKACRGGVQVDSVGIVKDVEQRTIDLDHLGFAQPSCPRPSVHVSPHRHDRGLDSQHLEDLRPPYVPCMDDHLHP